MGLSVAIVAMNEEAIIGQTLESVRWADEIVLVDSGSTDRTCDIAREYGARVLLRAWPGFSRKRAMPSTTARKTGSCRWTQMRL